MEKGKISFYSNIRAFGFIEVDEEEEKYFFHITDLVNFDIYNDEIKIGDKVKFKKDRNDKGLIAKAVMIEKEE